MTYNEYAQGTGYLSSEDSLCSDEAVGNRIRAARKEKCITQNELAGMLGISTSYISCIEKGRRRLTHQVALPIMRILNISYEYLITGMNSPGESCISAVCEASSYSERLKLERLIEDCTKSEYEMCYQLCSTYLQASRAKPVKKKSSPDSSYFPK